MNRRKALLTLGSLISVFHSGCTGVEPSSSSENTPTSTLEPTGTPPEEYWRYASLTEVDQPPESASVSVTADMVEPWITTNHTARLNVTLTNQATESRFFYGIDNVEEQGGLLSDTGVLLGMGIYPPKCVGTDGKESGPFGESGGAWVAEVEPGNSVTVEFGVVDDPQTRGCIPPGKYDFVWSIPYNKSGPPAGKNPSTFQWGLSFQIREEKQNK